MDKITHYYLKGHSSEIFISFFDIRILIGLGLNTNRFWFNNFWDPHDLITKTTFSRSSEETLSKKLNFSEIFLLAEIYLWILFLHNKFISETYFSSIKKVPESSKYIGGFKYDLLAAFWNLSMY